SQFVAPGVDVTIFDDHFRAESFEAFDMLVDWPVADDATAGQRDFAVAKAREQRAEQADGGAHFANEFVRRDAERMFGSNFDDALGLVMRGLDTEPAQDVAHELNVAQV